ncbi:MAG TPA: hypothetical protein PLC19_09810 [Marmoricola sp.]|nr:hypothetical protein [Marmoricola sp.]HNO38998.1 hypothetical protein [Marmoricola sp.]
MRAKLGRPDLNEYRAHFDLPQATDPTRIGITFLGVSSLLIDDGVSGLLTDGFFSRPGLAQVLLGKLRPNQRRINAALQRSGALELQMAGVLAVHSHYDHALDSAVVAEKLNCPLVGGNSTAQIGIGHGLDAGQILTPVPEHPFQLGPWQVTLVASEHCPPDRYPGEITAPVRPPVRVGAYRCGEAWSILVEHPTGQSILVQGSAGFVAGALTGRSAQIAYLGVGQLGLMPVDYIETYWAETVATVGAREVVLIHWDDFFGRLPQTPADQPLRALPYAGDDLDVTMQVFSRLAERDRVRLSFPELWVRADPWRRG